MDSQLYRGTLLLLRVFYQVSDKSRSYEILIFFYVIRNTRIYVIWNKVSVARRFHAFSIRRRSVARNFVSWRGKNALYTGEDTRHVKGTHLLAHLYAFPSISRYGRRTFLTLATSLAGVSGLIHSFSVNYWMFLAFEFLDAIMAAGIYSAGFILGTLITWGQ